jgi:hypothetical protein
MSLSQLPVPSPSCPSRCMSLFFAPPPRKRGGGKKKAGGAEDSFHEYHDPQHGGRHDDDDQAGGGRRKRGRRARLSESDSFHSQHGDEHDDEHQGYIGGGEEDDDFQLDDQGGDVGEDGHEDDGFFEQQEEEEEKEEKPPPRAAGRRRRRRAEKKAVAEQEDEEEEEEDMLLAEAAARAAGRDTDDDDGMNDDDDEPPGAGAPQQADLSEMEAFSLRMLQLFRANGATDMFYGDVRKLMTDGMRRQFAGLDTSEMLLSVYMCEKLVQRLLPRSRKDLRPTPTTIRVPTTKKGKEQREVTIEVLAYDWKARIKEMFADITASILDGTRNEADFSLSSRELSDPDMFESVETTAIYRAQERRLCYVCDENGVWTRDPLRVIMPISYYTDDTHTTKRSGNQAYNLAPFTFTSLLIKNLKDRNKAARILGFIPKHGVKDDPLFNCKVFHGAISVIVPDDFVKAQEDGVKVWFHNRYLIVYPLVWKVLCDLKDSAMVVGKYANFSAGKGRLSHGCLVRCGPAAGVTRPFDCKFISSAFVENLIAEQKEKRLKHYSIRDMTNSFSRVKFLDSRGGVQTSVGIDEMHIFAGQMADLHKTFMSALSASEKDLLRRRGQLIASGGGRQSDRDLPRLTCDDVVNVSKKTCSEMHGVLIAVLFALGDFDDWDPSREELFTLFHKSAFFLIGLCEICKKSEVPRTTTRPKIIKGLEMIHDFYIAAGQSEGVSVPLLAVVEGGGCQRRAALLPCLPSSLLTMLTSFAPSVSSSPPRSSPTPTHPPPAAHREVPRSDALVDAMEPLWSQHDLNVVRGDFAQNTQEHRNEHTTHYYEVPCGRCGKSF